MDGWKNISGIARAICDRARKVTFRGESPNDEWMGEVEVMCNREGHIFLHVERSQMKKYGGKKWHTQSVHVTLSAEAWEHIRTAPVTMERAAA